MMPEDDWKLRAACLTHSPALFFAKRWESKRETVKREKRAKRVCATCPVREQCLTYALTRNEKYGIWGGLTEKERTQMRRKMRRDAATC